MDLLERFLTGDHPELGTDPLEYPSARELRERLDSEEDPQLLFRELGLSAEEAAELDRLSIHFASIVRSSHPAEASEVIAQTERVLAWVQNLDEWLRGGSPEADWAILMLPLDFSEQERLNALQRIMERLGDRPIHPTRWAANREEIIAAAEDLALSVRELGEHVSWAAVRATLDELTVKQTRDHEESILRRFRATLQRLVCEELLPGHDWKHSRRRGSDPEELHRQVVEDEALAASTVRADVDQIVASAGLSEAEQELVDAYRHSGHWPTAARELEITQAAMRKRKQSLMAKLQKATGM